MVSNQTIQVRLTRKQKELAIMQMQLAGKTSMSNFVRELLIGKSAHEYKMLKEIYDKVIGENNGQDSV